MYANLDAISAGKLVSADAEIFSYPLAKASIDQWVSSRLGLVDYIP